MQQTWYPVHGFPADGVPVLPGAEEVEDTDTLLLELIVDVGAELPGLGRK